MFQQKPVPKIYVPFKCPDSRSCDNNVFSKWFNSVNYQQCNGDGVCSVCSGDGLLRYTSCVYAEGRCICRADCYEECVCESYCQCRNSGDCPHCKAGNPIHDVFNKQKVERNVLASAGGPRLTSSVGGGPRLIFSAGGEQSLISSAGEKVTIVFVDSAKMEYFFGKVDKHRSMQKSIGDVQEWDEKKENLFADNRLEWKQLSAAVIKISLWLD